MPILFAISRYFPLAMYGVHCGSPEAVSIGNSWYGWECDEKTRAPRCRCKCDNSSTPISEIWALTAVLQNRALQTGAETIHCTFLLCKSLKINLNIKGATGSCGRSMSLELDIISSSKLEIFCSNIWPSLPKETTRRELPLELFIITWHSRRV